MITLYKISPTGQTLVWSIKSSPITAELGELTIKWGVLNGAIQTQYEAVKVNMSGRNIVEQLAIRLQSRANKQIDKGYRLTIDLAQKDKGLNAAGLLRPMLAHKYAQIANQIDARQYMLQYKYDGHRCLITRVGDELIAYSRNGKPINTINHILSTLDIPEGVTLDGELYIHGKPLQAISSIVRRVQPDNKNLKYVLFDQIADDAFDSRFDRLNSYKYGSDVIIAPTVSCDTKVLTGNMIREGAMALGYEGFILRHSYDGYEPGKRSLQVLKAKVPDDDEFEIVDITRSADGWGILTCKFIGPAGTRTFNVSAPGTHERKKEFLDNKLNYVGRKIKVEFFNRTVDGTPFHPVAIDHLRDKEQE